MFKIAFAVFLAALATIDFIFLPRQSRGAWVALTVGFVLAIVAVGFTAEIERLASSVGIGRAVDGIIYVTSVILIRELFITRGRAVRFEAQLTRMARHIAISEARER